MSHILKYKHCNPHTNALYSLPARILVNGEIVPYLTQTELLKGRIYQSEAWKKRNEEYLCDLTTSIGVIKYIQLQDTRI